MSLGGLPSLWAEHVESPFGCPFLAPTADWAQIGATLDPYVPGPGSLGSLYIEWPGDGAPSMMLHEPPLDANDAMLAAYFADDVAVRRFTDGSEEHNPGSGAVLVLLPGVPCAYEYFLPDARTHSAEFIRSLRLIDTSVETPATTAPVATLPAPVPADTAPSRPPCPAPGGAFQRGDGWCAEIEEIQYWLNRWGYPVGQDGYFGPGTEAAVIAFQADQGLATDGLVGPRTWELLSEADYWDY